MPLRHEPLIAELELETRMMLSQVYLEACRELDTPSSMRRSSQRDGRQAIASRINSSAKSSFETSWRWTTMSWSRRATSDLSPQLTSPDLTHV